MLEVGAIEEAGPAQLTVEQRRAHALAQRTGRGRDGYEFQMLYGIRDDEQRRLAADGHTVRVYTPYGDEWYGYFMRRLAERPANMLFFARSLIGR